jgi:hypothetical protein
MAERGGSGDWLVGRSGGPVCVPGVFAEEIGQGWLADFAGQVGFGLETPIAADVPHGKAASEAYAGQKV